MGKKIHVRRTDMLFVMIVFCVFAASVLVVLTLSGSIYKNMSKRIQENYDEQTCLSYIWSKVKNADGGGRIYIADVNGASALCLEETYGGEIYVTRIYLYKGWVREIFGSSGLEFDLNDGMQVIKADSLSFTQTEIGLIKAEADTGYTYIYPRIQSESADGGADTSLAS